MDRKGGVQLYCNKCGKELEENQTFCTKCGARLNETDEPKGKELFLQIIFVLLIVITCVVELGIMVHLSYDYHTYDLGIGAILEFVDGYTIVNYLLIVAPFGYLLACACMYEKRVSEGKIITLVSFLCNIIFIFYALKKLAIFLETIGKPFIGPVIGIVEESIDMEIFTSNSVTTSSLTVLDVVTEHFWFFLIMNIIILIYSLLCFRDKR